MYRQQGRLGEARRALEEAVKSAPEWRLPYLGLGIVAEEQGDRRGALEAYAEALSKGTPAEAGFWESSPTRQEAAAAWKSKRPAGPPPGIEDLRAAVARNPERAELYLALARAELDAGNPDVAEELLGQVGLTLTSSSNLAERDWMMAEVYAARNDLDKAVEQGKVALSAYQKTGLYGPGSMGELYYGPLMYRRPAMARELMPQVTWAEGADVEQRRTMVEMWAREIE